MTATSFAARTETFGLDTADPWARTALRVLFSAPRVYGPLVSGWERVEPGLRAALDRLVATGLVAYQGGVLIDTLAGEPAQRASRRVPRYRMTAAGKRLTSAIREDARVLTDTFPRVADRNVPGVLTLLDALVLHASHAKFGLSARHLTDLSALPASNVKWWLRTLQDKGYVRELGEKYADVREVIPEHWRVTAELRRQLGVAVDAFAPDPQVLRSQFRLDRRARLLDDISPARVGLSGATDYDHDVQAQRVVGDLVRSPAFVRGGTFTIEPKLLLPTDTHARPWQFHAGAKGTVTYQPDALVAERISGTVGWCVIEYERFQSRRDGWNHIERFLGALATQTMPVVPATLRFVVDSTQREASYAELVAAFADYALDHPERLPANPVTLAVSSIARLERSKDPLAPTVWHRVEVPTGRADTDRRPVLHPADASPYDDYFARR